MAIAGLVAPMVSRVRLLTLGFVMPILAGCAVYVPDKDPLLPNKPDREGISPQGALEQNLVGNIRCEVQNALFDVDKTGTMPYLGTTWGTQVTLKLTWDEMAGLSPNVSSLDLLKSAQSFAAFFGATANAHSTRLETITFLWENRGLLDAAKRYGKQDCSLRETGLMIDSDLKIGEFIYDKSVIARYGAATTVASSLPQFSTFQEDLTFVGSYGASFTPTWKLTHFLANSTGVLAGATRTNTGDILITLGSLATDNKGNLLPKLGEPSASQHNAGVIGGSVASQINGQSH